MKMLLLFPLCSLILCQVEVGSENTLDIMTWNLKEFPYNGTVTVDYVDDLITSSHLDIIALQEISNNDYFNQLIDDLNDSESQYSWIGYRVEESNWALAYIINTSTCAPQNSLLPLASYLHIFSFTFYSRYQKPDQLKNFPFNYISTSVVWIISVLDTLRLDPIIFFYSLI